MMTILCYPRCTTCKKALKWLQENEIVYEERDIKSDNPSKEEIKSWYEKSGLPLKRFFNTSGNLYKEMKLKDKLGDMTEDEQIELLSTDGMLVKRPVLVGEDFVLTGFKETEWEKVLKSE
ncbi:MAG: arsenate reductase family protein [Lachnospiraceae bacterium]|nr:arsenate reductase family protein [Lachnospiraceae bacterium]